MYLVEGLGGRNSILNLNSEQHKESQERSWNSRWVNTMCFTPFQHQVSEMHQFPTLAEVTLQRAQQEHQH